VQTFKIALTIVVSLLLQMLLTKYLVFFRYIDLPLLVTVYFALQRSPILGMLVGTVSGIGFDIIGAGILGVRGFTKTLIGYLVAVTSIKFSLENPFARLAVVAVAAAADTVIFIGLNLMLENPLPGVNTWAQFGKIIGWRTLGDTTTAVFLYLLLDRLFSEQAAARRMAIKRRFYE
jgi:rod shape-determining protein MreD